MKTIEPWMKVMAHLWTQVLKFLYVLIYPDFLIVFNRVSYPSPFLLFGIFVSSSAALRARVNKNTLHVSNWISVVKGFSTVLVLNWLMLGISKLKHSIVHLGDVYDQVLPMCRMKNARYTWGTGNGKLVNYANLILQAYRHM